MVEALADSKEGEEENDARRVILKDNRVVLTNSVKKLDDYIHVD